MQTPKCVSEVGEVNVFIWPVGQEWNFEEGDQIAIGNLPMKDAIRMKLAKKMV